MDHKKELIPHLFRSEYRKITAVLCKRFGIEHMEMAEDIASETFLSAMETWPYKGIPEQPVAWLYAVARNKAINYINRRRLFTRKITTSLQASCSEMDEPGIDLSDNNITDSQLQMLFTLCHPSLSAEAQITLSLRVLCGFGIEEVANAFLTGRETITKRLFRAKEKLRAEKIPVEFPLETELPARLDAVLTTLYLLFNEGYYSESRDPVLREDLCVEAMRLTELLTQNAKTNQPKVNALLALMCFHSSRFEERKRKGGMMLYQDQDETGWDQVLITRGTYLLHQSAKGDEFSEYHLEAAIACWHTQKADTVEKWEAILHLYDLLLQIHFSPVAALNRIYALSKVRGKHQALAEAQRADLPRTPYYYTLLADLYEGLDANQAKRCLQQALSLAKTATDAQIIREKLAGLSKAGKEK